MVLKVKQILQENMQRMETVWVFFNWKGCINTAD